MSVSPGGALLWSAALHTLGFGLAGWATYAPHRETPSALALHAGRAHTLHFLTLTRPKPGPDRALVRPPVPPRRTPAPTADAPAPNGGPRVADRALEAPEQSRSLLPVQELAPGAVARVGVVVPPPRSDAPPTRGVDRAAALPAGAGAACPRLPLPADWDRRNLAVAVAVMVDSNGNVEPSGVRVVESPDRDRAGPAFYPRIYVVGARLKRHPARLDPAGYDALVTAAVTRHVAGLTFQPAERNGRPVSSTVLIACQRSPER